MSSKPVQTAWPNLASKTNKQKQNKGQRACMMLEHLPSSCEGLSSIPSSIENQIKTRQKGLRRGSPIERLSAMHKALGPSPLLQKEPQKQKLLGRTQDRATLLNWGRGAEDGP